MKVNIGNYPKRNGKRTVKVKIDRWDTYSLDSTLAFIILPALKQLKKDKNGTPCAMFSDEYNTISSSDAYWAELKNGPIHKRVNELEKEVQKKWDTILNDMIWSFDQVNKNWEHKYYSGKIDKIFVPLDKDHKPIAKDNKSLTKEQKKQVVTYLWEDGPKNTFKVDFEGLKNHQERMQKGFDLFGKYYFNLWW